MSVTAGDRDRATAVVYALSPEQYVDEFVYDGDVAPLVAAVAAALADERERARAPFLAWAAEVEEIVGILRRAAATEGKDYDRKRYTEMADEGQAVIDRIRRAAEESQ